VVSPERNWWGTRRGARDAPAAEQRRRPHDATPAGAHDLEEIPRVAGVDVAGKLAPTPIGRERVVERHGVGGRVWAPRDKAGRGDRGGDGDAPRIDRAPVHTRPAASASRSRTGERQSAAARVRARNATAKIHVDHLGLHDPNRGRVWQCIVRAALEPGSSGTIHGALPPPVFSPGGSRDGSATGLPTSLRDPDLVAIRSRWTLGSALHSADLGTNGTRLLRIANSWQVVVGKSYLRIREGGTPSMSARVPPLCGGTKQVARRGRLDRSLGQSGSVGYRTMGSSRGNPREGPVAGQGPLAAFSLRRSMDPTTTTDGLWLDVPITSSLKILVSNNSASGSSGTPAADPLRPRCALICGANITILVPMTPTFFRTSATDGGPVTRSSFVSREREIDFGQRAQCCMRLFRQRWRTRAGAARTSPMRRETRQFAAQVVAIDGGGRISRKGCCGE